MLSKSGGLFLATLPVLQCLFHPAKLSANDPAHLSGADQLMNGIKISPLHIYRLSGLKTDIRQRALPSQAVMIIMNFSV